MDLLVVGALGLALGAVINVHADSVRRGEPAFPPRFNDGSPRPPLAWLGIFAWLLNGRGAVPLRHPLTELTLAALLMLAQLKLAHHPPAQLVLWQAQLALFLFIAVVDIESRRVPLAPLAAIGALAALDALLLPGSSPSPASALIGAFLGGGVFALVYSGGRLYSRFVGARQTTAFGAGDVILMAVIGFVVGFPIVLATVTLAIAFGGIVALVLLVSLRIRGQDSPRTATFAYAPGITAAACISLIFQAEVLLLFGAVAS